MKKLLALVLTFVMISTLAACGKKNTPAPAQANPTVQATPTLAPTSTVQATPTLAPTPAAQATPTPTSTSTPTPTSAPTLAPTVQATPTPAKSEVGNTMKFGYITISVPEGFGEVEDWGVFNSTGPNWSTIEVSHGETVNMRPEEYTKEGMKEMLGDMLKDFKGEYNLNGNKAVYYSMQIDTEGGESYTRHLVWLFNADISAQYSIGLQYSTGDAFFTSNVVNQILNSITLAPEAQHLEGGFEG